MFHRVFFEVFLFGFCIDLYVKGGLHVFAIICGCPWQEAKRVGVKGDNHKLF